MKRQGPHNTGDRKTKKAEAPLAQAAESKQTGAAADCGGPAPSWRQTALLILLVWFALAVFAALWTLWARLELIVIFSAAVVGMGFTVAALFDHLWRRFGEKP